MELFYLLVCVAGLREFNIPDICMVYHLRPQYEMTQVQLDTFRIFICEQARIVAIAHGDHVTRCEFVDKIPESMTPIDPVIEDIEELET